MKTTLVGPRLDMLRKESRRLFNVARKSQNADHWRDYKVSLGNYKRVLRRAKRNSWKNFSGNMEAINENFRLSKILSTTFFFPSVLQREDASWTNSEKEALDLLVDTHFPGQELGLVTRTTISRSDSQWDYDSIVCGRN